jgi:NADPH2:quinone reductase
MKAIVINRHGGPEVLEAVEMASPTLQPGEILVRVAAAAVNPADYKWRAGLFATFMPVSFPHVLGYDVAGEVVAGTGFSPGTRVFGMLDPLRKGGYAEYVATSAALLAPMPDELDFPTAAAIPTAGLTGLQMVERGVDVQPGQTILVTGATGAVGRVALHAAKARGAHVVAAVRAVHGDAARALVADAVVALGEEDWHGDVFHHILDTVGGDAVSRLCQHLKPGWPDIDGGHQPDPGRRTCSLALIFCRNAQRRRLRASGRVGGGWRGPGAGRADTATRSGGSGADTGRTWRAGRQDHPDALIFQASARAASAIAFCRTGSRRSSPTSRRSGR